MAGTNLFALIDDITVLLDDVAVMAKIATKNSGTVVDDVTKMSSVAAKKTAGVLGDDLALNAQQITEEEKDKKGNLIKIQAARELPVVWEVFKGSMKNKVILVPAALGLTAVAPWSITPLLMVGGAFLCYEGAEKILEKVFHKDDVAKEEKKFLEETKNLTAEEIKEYEKDKIKGAVKTDFILSAEIVVIALGTMAAAPFLSQAVTLAVVAGGMTVGVYGAVAGIVKADDLGLKLMESKNKIIQKIGEGIVDTMPKFMKTLSVLGTAAMFAVGGGILEHGMHFLEPLTQAMSAIPGGGMLSGGLVGLAAGFATVGVTHVVQEPIKKAWNSVKSFLGKGEEIEKTQDISLKDKPELISEKTQDQTVFLSDKKDLKKDSVKIIGTIPKKEVIKVEQEPIVMASNISPEEKKNLLDKVVKLRESGELDIKQNNSIKQTKQR